MSRTRTLADVERFVAEVAAVKWMSAPALTPEASALLAEHVRRLAAVIRDRVARGVDSPWNADVAILAVGTSTPESEALTKRLFEVGAGPVREHTIFQLHAYFFWETDVELARFANPYEPLWRLYQQGFTTSGGTDEVGWNNEMTLGWKGGEKTFNFDMETM